MLIPFINSFQYMKMLADISRKIKENLHKKTCESYKYLSEKNKNCQYACGQYKNLSEEE